MLRILDIGSQLVATRRAGGVSQRELGQRLGVRQQQVARWEAAAYRTASLERIDAAARALRVGLYVPGDQPLAADAPAAYGTSTRTVESPVRDLGEIAARIREHGDELRDRYTISRVGVFGSFALGEQMPDSDVDLLVDITEPGGFRFIEAADFVEEILGRKVDFCQPEYLRERLRDRVLKDVVYVWSA